MNATRTARCALLAGLLLQGISSGALGATCTSAASGNWNAGATWAAGCGAGGPVAGDTVNVGTTAAHTVTIPAGVAAAAATVTIGDTGVNGAKGLTLAAASSTLTVSGAVAVNHAGNNNSGIFTVGPGSATMASLTLTGGNAGRTGELRISTGTATVTGNITFAGTTANTLITFTGNGTLRIGGALGNGATFTAGTGTVEYNGGGAQTINNTYSYNNLAVNKGGGSTATLGGNTTVGGNLTVTAGTLALSTFTANRTAAGGTISVANGATLNIGGTNTFPTNYTTHTLQPTSTVNYSGTAQAVTAETYGHLTLSGSATKTPAAGTTTIAGNFTLGGGVTYAGTTNNPVVNLAGNFSNSGTFNSGTGTFTFNGGGAQTLTGATTFTNLRMNNSGAGLTINNNVTVSTLFTLTSGVVTTGANTLITSANCPGSVSRASGHVAGFLRLRIPGPATCTFHVGDSATYRPISVTFAAGTTAGDMTGSVSQAGGDHPNISTSGLDDTQSANRYWTLTNSGVGLPAAGYSATFTFVAGDVDGGADPLQFEVERWDGAAWNTTTVGTRTSTSTQATGITAFGVFASAKKKVVVPAVGGFNAYETSTAGNPITGVIKTKIAGSTISLDMIALNSAKTAIATTFTGTVRVEVLNASNNSGALDANGCRPTWTVIQTLSPDPTFTDGRDAISFTQANSYPNVRLRITYPAGAPTVTGCSSDNFAIRPNTFASFAVTDTDWQTTASPGLRALNLLTFAATTPTHKAGRPFSVRATARNAAGAPATTTNYTGAPTATLSACAGAACTASFGTLTLNTTFAAGQLASDVASYDNVGSFRLELIDSSFASVDAGDSSALEREIRSGTIDVGRFVPDHFAVLLNTPVFGTACGSFTYIGQAFNYSTAPVITVTAQDFANNTATLYNTIGAWFRITNASLTGKAYTAATGTLDTTGLPGTDPAIAFTGAGVGTLTFGSGSGLFFTRTTPTAPASPFNADISLAINVIDADGVTLATNPARFSQATSGNGIAFSAGKPMRFGRLALRNANGSQLATLPVQLEAQYWLGAPSNTFVTNTADTCTSIAAGNVAMSNFTDNLSGSPTCETAASGGGVLSGGRRTLLLAAPGNANNGGVNLTVNLGVSAAGTTCTTAGGAPVAATTANLPHLQGNWTGGAYSVNPSGRATFGVYKGAGEVIFIRENF